MQLLKGCFAADRILAKTIGSEGVNIFQALNTSTAIAEIRYPNSY